MLPSAQDVLDHVQDGIVRAAPTATVLKPISIRGTSNFDSNSLRTGSVAVACRPSAFLRGGRSPFGIGPNSFLICGQRLVGVEPADDDQRGVVRVIPLVVVPLDDLGGRVPDVLLFADDRVRVRRVLREQQRQDRLVLQVPRVVLVARPAPR